MSQPQAYPRLQVVEVAASAQDPITFENERRLKSAACTDSGRGNGLSASPIKLWCVNTRRMYELMEPEEIN